jgi:putative endonuclease
MAIHNETGKFGEAKARAYLVANGYTVRCINWHFKQYEIDIIAQKDDWLVMVEVKTRSANYIVHPIDTVNRKKIKNLLTAANYYIAAVNWKGDTRFDIISVLTGIGNSEPEIEHIQDAIFPSMLR